jgi:Membrane domain of glycerophosphoryl diester phosphodiesterase
VSSDEPGFGGWATPDQPPPQPPFVAPPGGGGWASAPPPPPYGWGPSAVPQAPKPGVVPLRPLAVGELLDGAFTTIRRYPAATLGFAAAVMLVVETVQVAASYYLLHGVSSNLTTTTNGGLNNGFGDFAARSTTVDGIVLVVTLVATSLLSGVLAAIVGQGALGRPMSLGQAWQATRARLWRLLGATLLVLLIGLGIVIGGALPGVLIAVAGAQGLGIGLAALGGFAASFFAIYVTISLTFTTPALMLEKQGIRASMSRSRTLVKGSWWRVFGIFLLSTIIADVVAGIIVTPFSLAGGSFGSILSGNPSGAFNFTALLLTGIGGLIGATLVRPFAAGVIALLYLDRRMRSEALDLTLQQAAANASS